MPKVKIVRVTLRLKEKTNMLKENFHQILLSWRPKVSDLKQPDENTGGGWRQLYFVFAPQHTCSDMFA